MFERDNTRPITNIKSKDPTDECYTQKEFVETEFPHILPYLSGKKVLSPCDTEESEIVKFLSAHAEEYNYEYRYSIEDMFTNPDVEWCDIVVTNPPFSKSKKFLDTVLKPLGKDWLMFTFLGSSGGIKYQARSWRVLLKANFNMADGSVRKIPIVLCSSVPGIVESYPKPYNDKNKEWEVYSVSDLFSKDLHVYSVLYSVGAKELYCSYNYGSEGFQSMTPMEEGKFYVVPVSDLGYLPDGFVPVRNFKDTVLSCTLNRSDGTNTYERIVVYKE